MNKIFISIPWFSPAYKAGGPIQSVKNLVENFSDGVEYFIFCSCKDSDGSKINIPQADEWISYNNYTRVWYNSSSGRSSIKQHVESIKPDVIFIIGLYNLQYNIIPLFIRSKAKIVLSVRGMLHPGALSQKPFKKKIFLFLMKLSRIKKRFFFHATDEAEKKYILEAFGKSARVVVAHNFPHLLSRKEVFDKVPHKLKLVTIALISPMKNHSLVLDALGACKQEIVYSIYGPVKEKTYWDECLRKINLLPPNIKVNYEGEMQPYNIETALHKADVFIMPSKSENYGHAIIEALSAGLPVITSHHTPWQNLRENSAGINTGENPVELLEAISYFAAMDTTAIKDWSSAATAYALKRTGLGEIEAQYEALFSVAG